MKRSLELLPLLPIPQGEWTKDLGYLKEEIIEERKKTFAEFKSVAQGLKEYLEEEGVKEVEIGSYYEPVEV